MDQENFLNNLIYLVQLEINTVKIYETALKDIYLPHFYRKILGFKNNHIHYINNVNLLISKYGGHPFHYHFYETTSSVQTIHNSKVKKDMQDKLLSILKTEEMIHDKYQTLLENKKLNADVIETLSENLIDEKKHLSYLNEVLSYMREFQRLFANF